MTLRWRIPARKIVAISNGIDADPFGDCDPARRTATRRCLGVSPSQILCLAVGRLSEEKNYSHMIRSFMVPWRIEERLRLVIAGEGCERERLQHEIEVCGLTGYVSLLGLRQDVPELLHAADIFLVASVHEGFGMAACEAMAAARPIVATDVRGLRDVVQNGRTGFLVPSDDVGEFGTAILNLARNRSLREYLGKQGSEWVRERFSVAAMVTGYEKLYEELLGHAGHHRNARTRRQELIS